MKIILERGQNLWFTSDTHYHHKNICKPTSEWIDKSKTRDFKSLDHMNDTLVNNINEVVLENDILFHLGDWSFGSDDKAGEFRNRIVCKNVHLLLGNHDHRIESDLFTSVHDYLRLTVKWQIEDHHEEVKFVLMHFPIASWDGMSKGVIHLHGHVHLDRNMRLRHGKMMDVGVDGNNYKPMNMKEIMKIMEGQRTKSMFSFLDHHDVTP